MFNPELSKKSHTMYMIFELNFYVIKASKSYFYADKFL